MGKKNYERQLSGQIGESLVVAELGRRKIVATAFAGNVPEIDILAWRNGGSIGLQVKSLKNGNMGVNAANYLQISQDGDVQTVVGIREGIRGDLIYVFVYLADSYGNDEFYLISQHELAEILKENYSAYLRKFDGVRPKNPKTTHSSILRTDLEPYKNRWEILDIYLPN